MWTGLINSAYINLRALYIFAQSSGTVDRFFPKAFPRMGHLHPEAS